MGKSEPQKANWQPAKSWLVFALVTILFLWTAHLLAFFSHEYSHAFTAWLLGWKSHPLALNYGHWNIANVLAQFEIDENVDYVPIFARGHRYHAGFIALAGLFVGNFLITYPLSRWAFKDAMERGTRSAGLFFYWLCVASVGNLIDYVPVRTFTQEGDMYTLAKGFNCSPWLILIVLGIPFGVILGQFFLSFAPKALLWLFPKSPTRRALMVILTALAMFGFYGAAGIIEKDSISQNISRVSLFLVLPLSIVWGFWRTDRFWLKTVIPVES